MPAYSEEIPFFYYTYSERTSICPFCSRTDPHMHSRKSLSSSIDKEKIKELIKKYKNSKYDEDNSDD